MSNISDKLLKVLGKDTVDEMDALKEEDLKGVIVQASQAMEAVKEELEANDKYLKAKEDVLALSQGKKEVDKRQKAKIKYALHRLSELGSMDSVARQEILDNERK